jgi:hypothetical protein
MGGHPVEAKKRFSIQCVDHRALQIELFLRARSVGALAVASALLLTCLSAQSASAQTFKTLYTFCQESGCKDGKLPKGGVAINAAGNLYGPGPRPMDQGQPMSARFSIKPAMSTE